MAMPDANFLPVGTCAQVLCPPFRGRDCVVTGASATHALAVVLKKQDNVWVGDGEAWPNWDDMRFQHSSWQLGKQLRIEGRRRNTDLNGMTCVVVQGKGHPLFKSPDNRLLFCVQVPPNLSGTRKLYMEPRFLVPLGPAPAPLPLAVGAGPMPVPVPVAVGGPAPVPLLAPLPLAIGDPAPMPMDTTDAPMFGGNVGGVNVGVTIENKRDCMHLYWEIPFEQACAKAQAFERVVYDHLLSIGASVEQLSQCTFSMFANCTCTKILGPSTTIGFLKEYLGTKPLFFLGYSPMTLEEQSAPAVELDDFDSGVASISAAGARISDLRTKIEELKTAREKAHEDLKAAEEAETAAGQAQTDTKTQAVAEAGLALEVARASGDPNAIASAEQALEEKRAELAQAHQEQLKYVVDSHQIVVDAALEAVVAAELSLAEAKEKRVHAIAAAQQKLVETKHSAAAAAQDQSVGSASEQDEASKQLFHNSPFQSSSEDSEAPVDVKWIPRTQAATYEEQPSLTLDAGKAKNEQGNRRGKGTDMAGNNLVLASVLGLLRLWAARGDRAPSVTRKMLAETLGVEWDGKPLRRAIAHAKNNYEEDLGWLFNRHNRPLVAVTPGRATPGRTKRQQGSPQNSPPVPVLATPRQKKFKRNSPQTKSPMVWRPIKTEAGSASMA